MIMMMMSDDDNDSNNDNGKSERFRLKSHYQAKNRLMMIFTYKIFFSNF